MAHTLTLINHAGQTLARHTFSAQNALRVAAMDNVHYQLADSNGLAPQQVSSQRQGNDLHVQIAGEQPLVIENYFAFDDTGLKNPLIGLQNTGQYIAYPLGDAMATAPAHLLAEEMAVSTAGAASVNPAIAIASIVGIAAAGMALANSNGDDSSPSLPVQPQTPFDPNQNLPAPTPVPPPTPNPTPVPPPAPNNPPSNNPPSGSVTISGTAEVGQILTAANTLRDADGLGTITYQWLANGQVIATGNTYTLTAAETGKTISVQASYTDGKGHSESVSSPPTSAVINNSNPPPVDTTPPTLTITAAQNTLAAGASTTLTFTLSEAVQGFTADDIRASSGSLSNFTQTTPTTYTATYTAGSAGNVSIEVAANRFSDLANNANTQAAHLDLIITAAPVASNAQVVIQGDFEVGEILQAIVSDNEGVPATVRYQWFANGQPIAGANGDTYRPTNAELGKTLTVEASFSDNAGNAENARSAPTPAIAHFSDDFSRYAIGDTYGDGDSFGAWQVPFAGYGHVKVVDNNANPALELKPMTQSGATSTSSTLVLGPEHGDNFTYSGQISTPEQLRQGAAPNAWETAWVVWNYIDNDHYYYFVARDNGWELGKRDPAYVGGQRFMATGSESWPLAENKNFTIAKNGNTVEVSINGTIITTFTDHENPHHGGRIGIYTEDARVLADNISLSNHADIHGVANNGGIVSISGTAKVGETLQASVEDGDGVVGAVSYQWYAAGAAITGATQASYLITANEDGKALTVRATYTDGGQRVESIISAPSGVVGSGLTSNQPGVAELQGEARVGATLEVTVSDANGLPDLIQYTWLANGAPIAGATTKQYTLQNSDLGKHISVQVYYYDKAGYEENLLTPASDAVSPSSPANTPGTVEITGEAKVGQILSATVVDPDGYDAAAVSYQWLADGQAITGATAQRYTLSAAEAGKTITVQAIYTDNQSHRESVSSQPTSAVIDNTPQDITPPELTISAAQSTLTVGESTTLTFTFTEPVLGFELNDISSHSGIISDFQQINPTTYTARYTGLSSGTVEVAAGTFSDAAANMNVAGASLSISAITQGTVSINGVPKVGNLLTVTIIDGGGINNPQYQWLADGVAIANAKQSQYTVTADDLGKVLTVQVHYTDGSNTPKELLSDATIAVQASGAQVFRNIEELMNADLAAGAEAEIMDFNNVNDNLNIHYTITDTLPTDGIANRIAVPLANGKYALPQIDDFTLPVENSAANIEAMLAVARTYLDAGSKLVWDGNGQTPLNVDGTPLPSKTPGGQDAFAITCSTFINMVLSGWKYSDTTYEGAENISSYGWGIDLANDRPQGDSGPFGANRQLKWFAWKDQVALYNGKDGGEENYQIGDILFFSKQDPEGVGTGGKYFMNVYHSAIYIGNNQVMHSAGTYHGNGVVIETINPLLKADLTYIARPHLGNSTLSISGRAEVGQTLNATVADSDGVPASGVHYQWYANNKPIAGATAQSYTLTAGDAGQEISVRARFTDSSQYQESPTSAIVTPGFAAASNQPGSISLNGNTREGDTLHVQVQDGNGVEQNNIEYQWFANKDRIASASGSSYRLTDSEVGTQIHVIATYQDNDGYTETLHSDYSSAIRGAPVAMPTVPDSSLPTVSLQGASEVREGQQAEYTVQLSAPAPRDMSVDIAIVYDSADSRDAAIRWNTQRVVIKQGQSSATFVVETQDDGVREGNETYRVEISHSLSGTVYTYASSETPPAIAPVDAQSVIIPSYHYPAKGGDAYWQAVQAQGGGKVPFTIVNPASGPGKAVDANYSKLIADNITAGIDNIAYVKTVYGTRPLADVKADIQKYFDFYGKDKIHGFFFDEVGTQSNQQTLYMAELYNHVKALSADMLVIANPGAYITDSIAPYADIFVSREVSADSYINDYKAPRSAFENNAANAKHLYHIIHSASADQYEQLIALSRERNAGWLFITSDSQQPDNNPYNDLPLNFGSLIHNITSLGTPDNPKGDIAALPAAAAIAAQNSVSTTIIDAQSPRILGELTVEEEGDVVLSAGLHPESYAALLNMDKDELFDALISRGAELYATPQNGVHQLQGGDGNDLLIASAAAEQLQGGKGADDFVFVATAHHGIALDHILDFHAGEDRIHLIVGDNAEVRFEETSQELLYKSAASTQYQSIAIHSHDGNLLSEADVLQALHIL